MLKNDFAYIDCIKDCINKIKKYVTNIAFDEFNQNEMIQDAVIRNFEIIGEASKKISANFKQSYFEIPWKEMAGMRDKLIHDYLGIDVGVIWKTIEYDIPVLEYELNKINEAI